MKRIMKMVPMFSAAGVVALSMSAWSADSSGRVTFTKDVLPILQEHCQSCHRPAGANVSGMIAPMPLTTYQETRPWAKAIAKSVGTRSMPPWFASPIHNGVFENERVMKPEQIKIIQKWVQSGAPRGQQSDAPEPINWPETGWTINGGEPDIVVSFDEAFWVGDDVDDTYENVSVRLSKEEMPKQRWLKAIEFKPGSEVVHHIIAYASGRNSSGGMSAGMLGGEAPGTNPTTFPEGYGVAVPGEANITFQMHYHKEKGAGTGVWDISSFGMEFHDKPIMHEVRVRNIAHGAFEIPPGNANWRVGGAQTFEKDTTIMGFMPHLHLRGAAAKYTAYYPDGTSEVLLDVPKYNFNWQIFYQYKDTGLKKVPAGTRVEFEMWFDNSVERGNAIGFNSGRPVSFGGPTWDEMDLGWINYADTEPRRISSD